MQPIFLFWSPAVRNAIPVLLTLVMIGGACERLDAARMMGQNFQAPGESTEMLAAYMPWFGDQGHISIGYSSQDKKVLSQQIDEARSRRISGFVVHWSGLRRPFTDRAFVLLQQVAHEKDFKVALLYNEVETDGDAATQDAVKAFDEAYKDYIGPRARYRDAYLTYNNRPVVFIFPKRGHADWNRVRERVNQWAAPPLLFYKDDPPPQVAGAFDGYFAWVHPGHGGWAPDGSDWGKQYLQNFFKNMPKRYPGKLLVGAAWPGFDDSRASWSLNRHMNARCGKTFDETLAISRSHDGSPPPVFLLVETWNDYEEGTAVEQPERWNCSGKGGSAVNQHYRPETAPDS